MGENTAPVTCTATSVRIVRCVVREIQSARRTRRGPLSSGLPASAVSIVHGPQDRPDNMLLVGSSRAAARAAPAVLLSFINTSPSEAVRLSVKLAGRTPTSMAGTILTAPPLAACAEFRGAVLKGKIVEVTVPARSLVVLTVHQRAAPARPASVKRPRAM